MKVAVLAYNPWVWIFVMSFCLGLCIFLPLRIQDDQMRRKIYRLVLIPASLLLIFYGYPVGIELFKRLAIFWS